MNARANDGGARRWIAIFAGVAWLTGCLAPAVAPVAPPAPAPAPTPAVAPAGPDPFAVEGTLTRETLPDRPIEVALQKRDFPQPPAIVGGPPKTCAPLARRRARPAPCGDRAAAIEALDAALATTDGAARDEALAGLETCGELPVGFARALRIEVAPVECADALAAPWLAKPPAGAGGILYDTIFGLGLSGMLSRAANNPPPASEPHTKDALLKYQKEKMAPWIIEQAKAIEALAGLGSQLAYYGRAVVAVEAGMAEMRFIDAMRQVPVPDEFEGDEELVNAYYMGLEGALEPRKTRGRDAALVGLGTLATIGLLRDERLYRTRELLSRMYGGAPINALDGLLLPPLSPVEATTAEERLAARLQTFYASLVFPGERARDEAIFRRFIERGVSLPHRMALRDVPPELATLYARARLELALVYWRKVDVDEAVALSKAAGELEPGARLVLAIALALRGGPDNAADMMVKAPQRDLGVGDVAALDAIADEGETLAGMAAYDAATIARLGAPAEADAAYWKRVAERYRKAEGLLVDIRYRREAKTRAAEAEETAAAIAK